MRAQVLSRPAPVESAPLAPSDVPAPQPGPGQVRVRVRACGLCHTDLHTVEGDLPLPKLPVIPGHQVVGEVDSVGQGVTALRAGDRVGVPWLYSACGECDFCRSGRENLCDHARFTGLHANGGYAEYMVVGQDSAYPIPLDVGDAQAAPLLCAGVIGYRALKLSEATSGGTVGLYGFGASAHIVTQLAQHQGCHVHVFTRGEAHRALARELGAELATGAEDARPASLDSAIIFAPAGALVPAALKALKKGGTLALAGVYMTPVPQMDYSLLYGERTVRSVANSTRQDVRDLLRLASEVPLRTRVQRFPLEQANEALRLLKSGGIDGAGALEIG